MLIHPKIDLSLEDIDPTVLEVVNESMQPLTIKPTTDMCFMMVLYNGEYAVALSGPVRFTKAKQILAFGWYAPGVRKLLVPYKLWAAFKSHVPTKRGAKRPGLAYYFDEADPRHKNQE